MRPLLGTTPRIVARRGVALDRMAVLKLTRDPFSSNPGDPKTLYLGERTQYRAASYVLDQFDREDGALGTGYSEPGGGFDPLEIVAFVAKSTGSNGLDIYDSEHTLDQWAEVTIAHLETAGDQVGVGVRWDDEGTGYLVVAEMDSTKLYYYTGGSPSLLDSVDTVWTARDVLRLEAQWNTLRVYRRGVLILSVTDTSLMTTGFPAISAADNGAIASFTAGPLRQEYVGMVADVGDISASLGLLEPTASPHSWEMTLINLAPVGGADRFSDLIRHGTNDGDNTFEIHQAEVRVIYAISGGSAPLSVADGRVEHPQEITESSLVLSCLGRDAQLTPEIAPGLVNYIPGVIGSAPDLYTPCGLVTPPTIVPGSPPSPPAAPTTPVATGPESGSADSGQPCGSDPIAGAYLGYLRLQAGSDISTVTDVSADPAGALASLFQSQNHQVDAQPTFSPFHSWVFFYRSIADVPGDTLTVQLAGGYYNPNSTSTVAGTATAEILRLDEPADLSELLGYTYTSPPTVAEVMASDTFSTPSGGTLEVNISCVRFFAIRLTNYAVDLDGPDEGYLAAGAPASIA